MSALQLDAVGKKYDKVVALRDLSMSIEPGEMFGLIGPDGAGKTTTIRLMCGLLKPDAGSVRVLGRDPVKEHLAVTQTLGYLSQRFSLYGDLSIDENISFFAEIHGLSMRDPAIRDRRERLLELTQLATVSLASRRAAVRRHEAEAGARMHARARAQNHPARRADHRRRSGLATRVLEAALRVSRAGHHDSDGDPVSRRGGAMLAGGAASRRAARGARYAGTPPRQPSRHRHGSHRRRQRSRDERARTAARRCSMCSCSASAPTSASQPARRSAIRPSWHRR